MKKILFAMLIVLLTAASVFSNQTGKIIGTGTGFFITWDGYILTCLHVVKDAASIQIYSDDKLYPATLVRSDSQNDLAILKVNGFFPALAFSPHKSARLGQDVFTVGYPNPDIQGISPKYTDGTVSSLNGFQDNQKLYQISVPVQPGNSGGPLLDEYGNVIGVVVAMLNAKTTFEVSGSLPQNVNYAVKSLYAKAMIDTMPDVAGKLLTPSKSKSGAINNAQESTLIVICFDENEPKPVSKKAKLYVVTDPRGGRVRIMNIVEKYHDGIELDPGRYKLEGSLEGYQTKIRWININKPEVVDVTLTLTPEPDAPAVTAPAQTTTEIAPKTGSQVSRHRAGDIWKEPLTGMEFVWVPGGCYQMGNNFGASIEKPVHEVCVEGFWLGKYEVTNRQFRKFYSRHDSKSYRGVSLNEDTQPAVYVSWYQINAFIKWLNNKTGQKFVLPSEAQWEYAARANTITTRHWGDIESDTCQYANVADLTAKQKWPELTIFDCRDGYPASAPVGHFKSNAFGLYDMLGNVWELCDDDFDSNAYSKHTRNNPVIKSGGSAHVARGGSWYGKSSYVHATNRKRQLDDEWDFDLGFRLALPKVRPLVSSQSGGPNQTSAPEEGSESTAASKVDRQVASLPMSSRAGDVWKEPVTGMEFVWVPEGCFMMGSPLTEKTAQFKKDENPLWLRALAAASSMLPYGCVASKSSYHSYFDNHGYHEDETPAHEVCLDGFWIGRHEVTQGQWVKILGNNPSYFKAGEEHPVENVSWNDVKQYIQSLNQQSQHTFALPTEAQWEYAARSGGRKDIYAGGNNVKRVAWHTENSGGKTHQVGSKAYNGLGIFDMSGNVWEWCEDVYDKNAYSKHVRKNPVVIAGGSARVARGGSWNYGATDQRTTFRVRFLSDFQSNSLGFRLIIKDGQKIENRSNHKADSMADEDSSLKSSDDSGSDKTKKRRSSKLDEAAEILLDVLLLVPWGHL